MKRYALSALFTLLALSVGLFAGRALAMQEQAKNYVVIQDFQIGTDQSLDEAIASLSDWVRAFRSTGKHSSVRLLMHEWGSKPALYIISETEDWSAIGTMFDDLTAALPEFSAEPFGFAGHADEILMEIPVM